MVMNLDKCIGCHTCSITCKNVWTNREGAEYMYFNNVETKPGIGYPKNWEDQEKWKGGWKLGKDGKLALRTGSKPERLLKLFYHPDQPEMDDYYEPWTYDYETLIHSKRRNHQPIARPRSLVTGERMEIKWGPNWEDDLANGESARQDINLKKMAADITLEFHDLFMKYLPRVCNHCLNPACVAACPSGAIYKREEDGVVLVSQDGCRGWRHCVPACPYKKVFFNWKTNKAEKCIFCFPRLENGLPTICADTCVGRLRYMGVLLYDMDKVVPAASTRDKGEIYHQVLDVIADPNDPEVIEAARKEGIPENWIKAAQDSPVYKIVKDWQLALPLHPEFRTLPMVLVRAASLADHAPRRGQLLSAGCRRDAHPHRVPRGDLRGRQHGRHDAHAAAPPGHARRHARQDDGRRCAFAPRVCAGGLREDVPSARHRQVQGPLQHPGRHPGQDQCRDAHGTGRRPLHLPGRGVLIWLM